MVHSADPKPRVSCSSELTSCYISHQNQIDRKESTGDDEDGDFLDRYPISRLLKLRNQEKSKTTKRDFDVHFIKAFDDAQVLESVEEEEDDELCSNATCFRAGDLVWAKAMASTWWPGSICRKESGKIFVSFFNGECGRHFRESEVVSFEKNFQAMWEKARGRTLEAIDCALTELGRRLVLGLKCPCQITLGECDGEAQRWIVGSKEMVVFEPVEVLRFVNAVAMCAWIDEVETLSAVRNGAQLNAFRSYNSIKRDWIYRETMRLSERGSTIDDDLEADSKLLDCLESRNQCVLRDNPTTLKYNVKKVCQKVSQEAEVSNEEREDKHNIFVDNVGGNSGICKEKRVEHLYTILTHLRCLALDPFYNGARGLQNENSISACLKILKYRHLVYQKDLDLISEQAIHHDYPVEISRENEISSNSVSHDGSIAANLLLEENIGIANTDGTQESQLSFNVWDSSKAVVRTEDAKEDCSLTLMVECPTVELSVALMKHTPDPNGETQIKRTQEILRLDSDVTQESQLFFNIRDSSKAVVNERTEDEEADCSITFMEECPTVEHSVALMKHTSDPNGETQIKSTQEILRLDSDGTLEPQLLFNVWGSSKAVVNERTEDAKVDCGLTFREECPAVEYSVALLKNTPDPNGETQIKSTQEVFGLDVELQPSESITKVTENENTKESSIVDSVALPSCTAKKHKYSETKNDDAHGSRLLSHVLKEHVEAHHCNKNGIDGRTMNMKVDFSLNRMLRRSPREVFDNVMDCDDKVGFQNGATRKSQISFHLCDDLIRNHPSHKIVSAANITEKHSTLGAADEGFSEGKKRHSQCAASNSSVGVQQDKLLCSWKRLYATPLSRDSPVSYVNATSKPSETNINSECPTSLHMKFPKDFKLPSKEELFKQFRPFGPFDYSKTKVFFYTGSAQVVFLHHLDAEAAYQYAKRKKIFSGQANVRFWLVQSNNLRTEAAQIPAPLSFPSVGSSVLSLKSCLKTSTSENKKKKRKLHQVKFATGSEINSSSAAVTKHGAFSQPESG